MAQLSAKLHGIGKLVRAITADHAHQDENDEKAEKECKGAPLRGIAKINAPIAHGFSRRLRPVLATVVPDPGYYHDQSKNEKSWRNHVSEDADIRTGLG